MSPTINRNPVGDLPCGFWISSGKYMVEKDSGDIPYFAVPGNDALFEDTAEMFDLIYGMRVYDLGDTIWYSPIRIEAENEAHLDFARHPRL